MYATVSTIYYSNSRTRVEPPKTVKLKKTFCFSWPKYMFESVFDLGHRQLTY